MTIDQARIIASNAKFTLSKPTINEVETTVYDVTLASPVGGLEMLVIPTADKQIALQVLIQRLVMIELA